MPSVAFVEGDLPPVSDPHGLLIKPSSGFVRFSHHCGIVSLYGVVGVRNAVGCQSDEAPSLGVKRNSLIIVTPKLYLDLKKTQNKNTA